MQAKMNIIKLSNSSHNVSTCKMSVQNLRKVEDQFFIQEVIDINGTLVPSIPFNLSNGEPLFMGDVIEINYDEDSKSTYMVDMKDGQYVGVTKNPNMEEPLWMLDYNLVNRLGNIIEKPFLINKLSN